MAHILETRNFIHNQILDTRNKLILKYYHVIEFSKALLSSGCGVTVSSGVINFFHVGFAIQNNIHNAG